MPVKHIKFVPIKVMYKITTFHGTGYPFNNVMMAPALIPTSSGRKSDRKRPRPLPQ
jgi:hypothetical protein